MSLRVVAVVISNDQPNLLKNCLASIEKQSFRPERVLVVDTSTNEEVKTVLADFIKTSSKHAVINIEERANFAELAALGIKQVLTGFSNIDDVAIWLVHDDSAAETHALAELARTLELSPLVGIAGPKQVGIDNSKLIVQQGLTLTKSLRPFSLVNDDLDQKQHDGMSDVLAVGTNAMLIRATLWAELGGFSLSAPVLSQDIELGIRARHAGYRVVVVPTARVAHAELSVNNKRDKKWLGGSAKYAVAKATNHLRLSQANVLLAFLYWLGLPVISLVQVFWLMLVKRPDRIGFTLRANLWAFFTFRARLRDRHGFRIGNLKSLFASRDLVRARSRVALELVEQKNNLQAFESEQESSKQLSFGAGGGLWIMLALGAISYQFYPLGAAISGGYALPLSDNWLQLFANTASSYQHVGLDLAAPSDPFNWVLLLIGSVTFWSPNLALSWLLILAKPLAFFGAWRAVSLVTPKTSIRIFAALAFSFWPAFTQAQAQGNIPAVVFSIALPWLIFSMGRVSKVGINSSVKSEAQTWSWAATAGLLLAVVSVSAPSVLGLIIVSYIIFALVNRKRIPINILVLLPVLVLQLPYWIHLLAQNQNPLVWLADPTVSMAADRPELVSAILGTDLLVQWFVLGALALALLGLLTKQRGVFLLWLVALLAGVNILGLSLLTFPGGGVGSIFQPATSSVFDSAVPSVMVLAISTLLVVAILVSSVGKNFWRRILLLMVIATAVAPSAYLAVVSSSAVKFADSRNLPAIFTAQAEAGSNQKLLVIASDQGQENQSFRAELISPAGIKLDTISTAYRLSGLNYATGSQAKTELATLVANLVSANGQSLTGALKKAGIGYVLVPASASNGEIQISLNTAAELDQVGLTEFGQLWRVKHPALLEDQSGSRYWSITKIIQLSVLTGFVLMALPTARGRKQRATNEFSGTEEQA